MKFTTRTVTTVELPDGSKTIMASHSTSDAGDNPRYGARAMAWHLDRMRQDHGVLWAQASEQPYHSTQRVVPSYLDEKGRREQ